MAYKPHVMQAACIQQYMACSIQTACKQYVACTCILQRTIYKCLPEFICGAYNIRLPSRLKRSKRAGTERPTGTGFELWTNCFDTRMEFSVSLSCDRYSREYLARDRCSIEWSAVAPIPLRRTGHVWPSESSLWGQQRSSRRRWWNWQG
jgi:hypothetical protein